jgi:hypothetical protein
LILAGKQVSIEHAKEILDHSGDGGGWRIGQKRGVDARSSEGNCEKGR